MAKNKKKKRATGRGGPNMSIEPSLVAKGVMEDIMKFKNPKAGTTIKPKDLTKLGTNSSARMSVMPQSDMMSKMKPNMSMEDPSKLSKFPNTFPKSADKVGSSATYKAAIMPKKEQLTGELVDGRTDVIKLSNGKLVSKGMAEQMGVTVPTGATGYLDNVTTPLVAPGAGPSGTTNDGRTINANSPEVQAYMNQYPGVGLNAAIGSVITNLNRRPVTAVDSSKAKSDALGNIDYFAEAADGLAKKTGTDRFGVGGDPNASFKSESEGDRIMAEREANYDRYMDLLTSRFDQMDVENQNAVADIKAQYDKKRAAMRTTNANIKNSKEILGTQSGRQRYAPGIQGDIMEKEVMAGIDRIEQIDQAERALINAAEKAKNEQQWKMLSEMRSARDKLLDDRRQTVMDMHKIAMDEGTMAINQAKAAREERKEIVGNLDLFAKAGAVLGADQGEAIDEMLGFMPGFSENYVAAQRATNDMEKAKSYADMAMKIPFGQSIDTPYGTTISGADMSLASRGITSFRETNKVTGDITEIVRGVDPMTGEYGVVDIKTYPGIAGATTSGSGAPDVKKINGKDSIWNPETAQWEEVKLSRDPEILKQQKETAQVTAKEITDLITHKGLNNAVGFGLGRGQLTPFSAQKEDFIGGVEELIKSQALDALVEAKKNGATFGAMSNAEWEILEKSRSKIGNWRITDKNGKVKGYKISEGLMKKELNKLKDATLKAVKDVDWESLGSGGGNPLRRPTEFNSTFDFLKATEIGGVSPYQPYAQDLTNLYKQQGVGSINQSEFNRNLERYLIQQGVSFSPDLNMSQNYSKSDLRRLKNGQTTLSIGSGTITGIDGSKFWKPGLDFVLDGGKNAVVKAPFPLQITEVVSGYSNPNMTPLGSAGKKQNGGFGNQVKAKLQNGDEVWISHLDKVANLRPGQVIYPGQGFATQGNTGNTYGTTGVHMDITMVKPNGQKYTAREVAAIFGGLA